MSVAQDAGTPSTQDAVGLEHPRIGNGVVRLLLGPVGILLVLLILFVAFDRSFLSASNFRNVSSQAAIFFVFAAGETYLVLMGRVDLSIGGVASLVSVLLPMMLPHIGPVAIAIVLVGAVCFGAVQGIVHCFFHLPSFVVTIAGLFATDGLALAISNGQEVSVPFNASAVTIFGDNRFVLGVPNSVILSIVLLLLASASLKWLPFGRRVYALGVSERAAMLAGIPRERTIIAAFALCAGGAGIGGVLLVANFNSGSAGFGDPLLLPALTAVVVGGTAISGGVGGMGRTFVGAYIVSILVVGVSVVGLPSTFEQVVYGVVLIVAVLVTTDRVKVRTVR
jgi:ribose transport system permease protein